MPTPIDAAPPGGGGGGAGLGFWVRVKPSLNRALRGPSTAPHGPVPSSYAALRKSYCGPTPNSAKTGYLAPPTQSEI